MISHDSRTRELCCCATVLFWPCLTKFSGSRHTPGFHASLFRSMLACLEGFTELLDDAWPRENRAQVSKKQEVRNNIHEGHVNRNDNEFQQQHPRLSPSTFDRTLKCCQRAVLMIASVSRICFSSSCSSQHRKSNNKAAATGAVGGLQTKDTSLPPRRLDVVLYRFQNLQKDREQVRMVAKVVAVC